MKNEANSNGAANMTATNLTCLTVTLTLATIRFCTAANVRFACVVLRTAMGS